MRLQDESVLIGSIMRDPERRFAVAAVRPEHFDNPERAVLWRVVVDLSDADQQAGLERPLHPERVEEATRGKIKDTSIPALFDIGESGEAVFAYPAVGERIIARWQLRAMRWAHLDAVRVLEQAMEDDDPRAGLDTSADVVSKAQRTIASADPSRGIRLPSDQAEATRFLLAENQQRQDKIAGMRSGFRYWDAVHKGAQPGLGYTIAPTGSGKTSWLLNLAAAICDPHPWNNHTPVAGLYINSEMPSPEMDTRMTAIRLGRSQAPRSLDEIEGGRLHETHIDIAARGAAESGLSVTAPAERTMAPILSMIGKAAIQHRVRWVGVDHLMDIVPSPNEKKESGSGAAWPHHPRWMRRLKGMANRYGICIEVLGHTGRDDVDIKPGKQPEWKNMQGGVAMLNVLDRGRILWVDKNMGSVISVTKNRGGTNGRVRLNFKKAYGTWEEEGKWSE